MATFVIGGTTATFTATIAASSQEAGELERVILGCLFPDAAEWADMLALVTTKYHVHVPLGGDVVLDIVRGPGAGTLTVSGLGTTTALLVELRRTRYLGAKSQAAATFLRTAAWS